MSGLRLKGRWMVVALTPGGGFKETGLVVAQLFHEANEGGIVQILLERGIGSRVGYGFTP